MYPLGQTSTYSLFTINLSCAFANLVVTQISDETHPSAEIMQYFKLFRHRKSTSSTSNAPLLSHPFGTNRRGMGRSGLENKDSFTIPAPASP